MKGIQLEAVLPLVAPMAEVLFQCIPQGGAMMVMEQFYASDAVVIENAMAVLVNSQ